MKLFRIQLVSILLFLQIYSCSESVTKLEPDSIDIEIRSDTLQQTLDSVTLIEDKQVAVVRKRIYLTIDDSPLSGSKYIDSIVNDKKVKTNIFMVGNSINGSNKFKKYFEMLQQNSHIEIYNHSYSHANNKYLTFYGDPQLVLEDFDKNQTEFSISKKIARLPGRNIWHVGDKKKNTKQSGAKSAELLAENGYEVYGWDLEWEYKASDYSPKQTMDELVERINVMYESKKTFTSEHIVLLMHDQMFVKRNDNNNLGELIDKLIENDYTFEYLSEYPKSESQN